MKKRYVLTSPSILRDDAKCIGKGVGCDDEGARIFSPKTKKVQGLFRRKKVRARTFLKKRVRKQQKIVKNNDFFDDKKEGH